MPSYVLCILKYVCTHNSLSMTHHDFHRVFPADDLTFVNTLLYPDTYINMWANWVGKFLSTFNGFPFLEVQICTAGGGKCSLVGMSVRRLWTVQSPKDRSTEQLLEILIPSHRFKFHELNRQGKESALLGCQCHFTAKNRSLWDNLPVMFLSSLVSRRVTCLIQSKTMISQSSPPSSSQSSFSSLGRSSKRRC